VQASMLMASGLPGKEEPGGGWSLRQAHEARKVRKMP
jgi:hypothetical protein